MGDAARGRESLELVYRVEGPVAAAFGGGDERQALPDQERRIVEALIARGSKRNGGITPARPQARDDSVA